MLCGCGAGSSALWHPEHAFVTHAWRLAKHPRPSQLHPSTHHAQQDAKARGKKAAGGSAKKKGASRKAAAAKAAKEPEEEQEEVVSSEEEAEQQPQGGRSRSGTARLAAEKAAVASKGEQGGWAA